METRRTWCRLKTGESRRVVCLAAWMPPRMASSEVTGGICANLSAARRAVQTNSVCAIVVATEDLTLPRVSREHGSSGAPLDNELGTAGILPCGVRRLAGVYTRGTKRRACQKHFLAPRRPT